MLVPFTVDPSSLASDPLWTPAQVQGYHQSLLDVWGQYGLLVQRFDATDATGFLAAIDSLPQKQKLLWQAACQAYPLHIVNAGWNGSISRNEMHLTQSLCDLALIEDAAAEIEFGFAPDDLSKPFGVPDPIELCRFIAADKALSFRRAGVLAGVHIEPGDSYEKTWKARFHGLAIAPIKRISIVDRYAVSRHFGHTQSAETGLSGLERFLKLLDMDSPCPRYIALYSAWTSDISQMLIGDIKRELSGIISHLPRLNVKRIKVCMIPNAKFSDLSHDRFVRFENYVWDLGLGLQVFEGPRCQERSSAQFKSGEVVKSYISIEQELASLPDAKSEVAP